MGSMIQILITHGDDRIEVSIKGHAGYNLDGKDVVCAGISALAQGILEYLDSLHLVRRFTVKKGHLSMVLMRTAVSLHMVRMLVSTCESILKSYPGTIDVKEVDELGS